MPIFSNPASGTGRIFRATQRNNGATSERAINYIQQGVNQGAATLGAQSKTLSKGLTPQSISSPGLGITVDSNGNTIATRGADAQGWMDTLKNGLNTDTAAYGDLLNQIQGIGNVPVDQIRADYEKQYGDLQSQMAQRRILGSSFAQGSLDSIRRQEALDVANAKYNALKDQITMTQGVINDRTTARLNTVNQGLSQINYETGVANTIGAQAQAGMLKLADAQTDIAKTLAALQTSSGVAEGDVLTNQSGLNSQLASNQAQLKAEGAQSVNNSTGALLGAGLGFAGSVFSPTPKATA